MKINGLWLILAAFTGCVIDAPGEYKFLPAEDDVALLHSGRYISHSSTELVFESEVVVLNSFYEGFNNDYLTVKNFEIKGNGTYTLESFRSLQLAGAAKRSSMVFIMDQSGSYKSIDPYNARSQAINKFLQDIVQPNQFLVGASARKGMLTPEPLEVFTTEFGNDWRGNSAYLFGLSQRTGGLNSILDAADQAIELWITNTEPIRRDLILMVHANDESSTTSLESLILKAKNKGVTIHVISLGTELNTAVFAQMSQETGGLFAACTTDKQLIKVFRELERLINRETFVYKMRIRFKPAPIMLQPGSGSVHKINIQDKFLNKPYNPVYLKITIPS